jgi:hypothetical protein
MGLFDTFTDKCPKCGKNLDIQTKLLDQYMNHFKVGDNVTGKFYITEEIIDIKFIVSEDDKCDCGYQPVVVVKDKVFVGFE